MRIPRGSLAPLASPAFRRYLLAATIISICLWTYQTSVTWTLLTQTGSAASVSLLQTLMTVPLPLAMLPAGLLTDRFGSRPMMLMAIAGYTLAVGLTGIFVLGDAVPVAGVLALGFLLGCFDALNVVAAPVFVGRSVPPGQMAAAIGLSALNVGLGRILGGALGGAVVSAFGPSAALLPATGGLVMAMAVVATLPRLGGADSAIRWRFGDVVAAMGWARRTPVAIALLMLGATVALFLAGYVVLLPVVARDLLGAGPAQLGLLTASGGAGVIAAAFLIDPIGRRLGRGRTIIASLAVASLLLAVLAAVRILPASALTVGLLAGAASTFSATTNLLLQSLAPPNLRGRAVALYGLVYYSLQPIGLFGAGVAADGLGVAAVLAVMGACALAAGGAIAIGSRVLLSTTIPAERPQGAAAEENDTRPTATPVDATIATEP